MCSRAGEGVLSRCLGAGAPSKRVVFLTTSPSYNVGKIKDLLLTRLRHLRGKGGMCLCASGTYACRFCRRHKFRQIKRRSVMLRLSGGGIPLAYLLCDGVFRRGRGWAFDLIRELSTAGELGFGVECEVGSVPGFSAFVGVRPVPGK